MENKQHSFQILEANESHLSFAQIICDEMAASAQARGTGIAKRTPEYIQEKMKEGKAVIAFNQDGIWAGFCYIETWSHGEYVANSGLIVAPAFRKGGLAKAIKKKIFDLSRKTYPESKLFGLTTGLAVMKINSELGYEPVTYSELTQDEAFWAGCKSCVNYEILMSKDRKNCMCTAMLYDPKDHYEPEETKQFFEENKNIFERLLRFKEWKLLKPFLKKESAENGNSSGPTGRFRVIRKDEDHRSSLYGAYVNASGTIVKANVDTRRDRKPPHSHFVGASMPYFLEFSPGYGLHQGYLPGEPASHGCIRMPYWKARQFYKAAHIGTPVLVRP